MEKFDEYIWKVTEDDIKEINDHNAISPGWYFQDEAEMLNGPYSSRQEALDALDAYAKWLNGESK